MSTLKLWSNRIKHLFYLRLTSKQFLTAYSAKYDLRFRFSIKDGVGKDIYCKFGVYSEDYITDYLLKEIGVKDEDFIIDIGANIGWYSLTLSSAAAPTIFSFEPDALNFSLLHQNAELNNKTNIRLFNVAVSNENGTKTLFLYKDHNLGRHSLIQHQKSKKSIEVTTVKLDDVLVTEEMNTQRIKLMKLDIEGFEYMALLGATEALKRCDNLLLEFSPDLMKKIGQEPMDCIRLIQNTGFKIQRIDPSGLAEPDFEQIIRNNEQVNFFCRK
ncbi:MAG: FkbM family methyltransferase [Chitinophagaceae bacterium]